MKKSEKMLLTVFAVLFLAIAGGGGVTYAWKQYRGITDETERLQGRLIEMNTAITQGADWQRKADWIEENVPNLGSRQEASSRLLDRLQKEASSAGVTLGSKEFIDPSRASIGIDGMEEEEMGYFDQATVRVTIASTSEQALFKWLHTLTEPKAFLGVTRLRMSPTGEGKSVNCELEVTQFYRESSETKLTSTK